MMRLDKGLMPLSSPFNTEAAKKALLQGRELLHQRYCKDKNSAVLLRGHSHLVDKILQHVWREMAMPGSIILLAVGGYGRRQLFPHSDVDLLVLVSAEGSNAIVMNANIKARLECWVRSLWDIGMDVGHSIRTVAECIEEAAKDISVQTSLLEARQLAGYRQPFTE